MTFEEFVYLVGSAVIVNVILTFINVGWVSNEIDNIYKILRRKEDDKE